jgi:hypothetical protein
MSSFAVTFASISYSTIATHPTTAAVENSLYKATLSGLDMPKMPNLPATTAANMARNLESKPF